LLLARKLSKTNALSHLSIVNSQLNSISKLKQFYCCLASPKEKAIFMLYAATGLRREEILSLKPENIDFQKVMITPNNHESDTKKSWVSFYNEEAEITLKEYLETKKESRSQKLFPMQRDEMVELWKTARTERGIAITPQKLRQ
jgi:integrase